MSPWWMIAVIALTGVNLWLVNVVGARHAELMRDRRTFQSAGAMIVLNKLLSELRNDDRYPQGQIRAAARNLADDIQDRWTELLTIAGGDSLRAESLP